MGLECMEITALMKESNELDSRIDAYMKETESKEFWKLPKAVRNNIESQITAEMLLKQILGMRIDTILGEIRKEAKERMKDEGNTGTGEGTAGPDREAQR